MSSNRIDATPQRIVAVDVLRGLVLVLLLPDLYGGFSFYRMAELNPGHWAWEPLSRAFMHVPWTGVAVWDLVMPVFVFLVGVAMALSYDKRKAAAQPAPRLLGHAALRSLTLVVLGMLLLIRVETYFDEILPYLVMATGLPLAPWWRRVTKRGAATPSDAKIVMALSWVVVVGSAAWIVLHSERLGDYELDQILVLIGLAYFPAFCLQRYSVGVQAASATLILLAYGAAFIFYQAPATMVPIGETFSGIQAHWNNGANLGAAVDQWLLNALPRSSPYAGNAHGYYTLQFVPLIAVILAGTMVGRQLLRVDGAQRLPWRLAAIGTAGLVASGLLAATLVPMVKSLWTPSWTVFSTSVALLALAASLRLFRGQRASLLALPLVVLGSNALLLYVSAYRERWRVLALWNRWLGQAAMSVSWRPVLESCLVLLTLWALAWVLFRLKVFVRL